MTANREQRTRPNLRDVELRHLAALQAVARERSFGRAAGALGFTQSAVSQQIAALERIVGEPLFERPGGPKPVRITAAGEILLEHANAIFARLKAAEDDFDGLREGATGRVAVGTYESVSVKLLPEIIRRIRSERPGIEISLFESDSQDELLSKLGAGELDLSFVVAPVAPANCEVEELCVDPFVVISPVGQALGSDGAAPLEALIGLQLIGQQLNSCQVMIEAGMRRRGVQPNIVFRSTDNAAVQAMVRSGMAHAVMPRLAVDLDDLEVVVETLEPEITPRVIGIGIDPKRRRTPAVEAFLAATRDACASLMGLHESSASA